MYRQPASSASPLDHTPQSAPRKIAWTIHVTFLPYNAQKPDNSARHPVEFDVSGAFPTTETTGGISRNFSRHLESVGSVSKLCQDAKSNRAAGSCDELSVFSSVGNMTDKKKAPDQQLLLTSDSSIFELKEAIAQHCRAAGVFSDNFCLVFDKKVLPDWPCLKPKTLSELGLYDEAMVYGVEFDKEQYCLREALATRLVREASQPLQRKRRLESAFSLAQDCLQSAKGFTSLVEEEAFPPLDMVVIRGGYPTTATNAVSSVPCSTSTPSMSNRLEQLREKRRSVENFNSCQKNAAAINREIPEEDGFFPSAVGEQKSTIITTSRVASGSTNQVFFSPQQRHHNQRGEVEENDDENNSTWKSSGDRLLRKKYGLRGDQREESYREYFADVPAKKREAEERGMRADWLVSCATSEIE